MVQQGSLSTAEESSENGDGDLDLWFLVLRHGLQMSTHNGSFVAFWHSAEVMEGGVPKPRKLFCGEAWYPAILGRPVAAYT